MVMRAISISGVLILLASGCASNQEVAMQSIRDDPLANDGLVMDLTIFPYDVGFHNRYAICWQVCSSEDAGRSVSAIDPLVPGEFDGFHGDRPAHLRVRFEAWCFKPHALCADVRFFFQEIPN